MTTTLSFMDSYLLGLTKLVEFIPTDDVLIGAVELPEPVMDRDRKFFQLGQLIAVYGAVEILKYLLEKGPEEEEDDD